MKLRVQIVRVEARPYTRKDGKPAVAHQANVITPEGAMGQVFLGGDSNAARALYEKAANLVNQAADIVFEPREFQGKLELGPVDVVAAK